MPTCVFSPWRSTHILFVFIAWFNLEMGAYGDMLFQGTECLLQYMAPVHFSLLYKSGALQESLLFFQSTAVEYQN